MEIVVLLAVVLILGALLGGKSFGGTVRKGCGFLIMLLIIGIIVIGAQSGENGHPFRGKTDSDSVSKRTAIPEQNGHFSHLSAINF